MWKPNLWSRVVGPSALGLTGVGLLLSPGLLLAGLAVLTLAAGVGVSANLTAVEVHTGGLRCRRPIGSFEIRWDEVAGAVAARPSFVIRELVVLDAQGRYHGTGVWRWRSPTGTGSLVGAVAATNSQARAIPGVAALADPELRRVLDEYSREALLRVAGLDEQGAERRSDQMLGLWFLALFGSAALGGALAAILGSMWISGVVMVMGVAVFFFWAARQPRLPPQRRAVRIGRRR